MVVLTKYIDSMIIMYLVLKLLMLGPEGQLTTSACRLVEEPPLFVGQTLGNNP